MITSTSRWRRMFIVALCLGLLVVALGSMTASADSTEVVNPADLSTTLGATDWHIAFTAGSPTSGIVSGPATPPLGTGSLQMTTGAGADKRYIMNYDHVGVLLSAITTFGYSTYGNSTLLAPTLQLQIDPDGAGTGVPRMGGGAPVNFATLSFEPYNDNTVTPGVWQTWNGLTSASVWASNVAGDTGNGNNGTIGNPATWAEFVAFYPNAVISGGFGVNVGSGWTTPFTGHVDALKIGYAGNTTTYDFDPAVACTTICYADAVNGNDLNGGGSVADAKKTIQAAIDAVSAGGTVRVLPGSYNETATNRTVLASTPLANGPHQFGLFVAHTAKDGITIQGVTAADVAITDPNATEADITTNATNNFGASGIFVEADDVTIAGLEIGPNTPGENKTIEVIGDNFMLKDSLLTGDGVDGASPYINDWRYDSGTNTAHVQSYTITNNVFGAGSLLSVASGAGASGPVSGRQITDNVFSMNAGQNWPSISFNGDTTTVPWYTYPVGGAVITGNTFTNNAVGGQHIRLRGIADDSEFDWPSIWNDNTYNKAVMAGVNPPNDLRSFTYTCGAYTCNDTRRIGTDIQTEVDMAAAGDTVLVKAGTYPENITVNKSLTINGANAGVSPNDAGTPLNPNAARGPESVVTVTGAGRAFSVGAADVTIDGFKFTNSGAAAADVQSPIIGAGGNFGGDAPGVTILNNLFDGTSRMAVYFNGPTQMQGGTVDNNRVANPVRPTPCLVNQCGHQLFNLWKTNDLSFQGNVTFAPQAGEDRIRTLNIIDSTNVLIAGNTIRYTCNFTCVSIPGAATDVEIRDNDMVTDAGNVIQFYAPSSGTDGMWLTGNVNIHHNSLTTGNDFPIVVDNPTADLDSVHINRNAVSGTYHVRNGVLPSTTGTETVDVTCNWWGSAAGPNPANFFGPAAFNPWLESADLDGFCGGTIYVSADKDKAKSDPFPIDYDKDDILAFDPTTETWSMFFDGSAEGLTSKHDISAMHIADTAAPKLYLSFSANRVKTGTLGWVYGQDIVYYNGANYSLYFQGSDVGLTSGAEKVDSLYVIEDGPFPGGATCDDFLLISTHGTARVDINGQGTRVRGQDVLGFCLTDSGATTTGQWSLELDGTAAGLSNRVIDSLWYDAADNAYYFTTKGNDHSQVYKYDIDTATVSGPVFSAPDYGLNRKVDALHIEFD